MPPPPEFGSAPLAIVTGGAKRIGATLVRTLAAQGWRVLIHCNTSRKHADALAGEIGGTVVASDLAHPDAADAIMAAAGGAARLLVNNASRFVYDRWDNFTDADWAAHMSVNVRAPVTLTRAFTSALTEGAHGLVVNLLDAKLSAPNADYFSYTVSRYALAGATELLARALAPQVRVNAIAPTITMTSGPQNRADFERVHALNPLSRGVEADDLARALMFLVASPTITGQTITVDAGARFMGLPRDVAFLKDTDV